MSWGTQTVRFQVAPAAVVSLATNSNRYQTLQLVNYPAGAAYPDSAQELKSMTDWRNGKPTLDPANTLVYRLIHAMLVGVREESGQDLRMEFVPHYYGTSQKLTHIPPFFNTAHRNYLI